MVKLDQDFGSAFSGVLVDAGDRLRALWASYSEQVNSEDRELCAGLPTAVFAPFVRRIAAAEADFPGSSAGVCQVSPSSTTVTLELFLTLEQRSSLGSSLLLLLSFVSLSCFPPHQPEASDVTSGVYLKCAYVGQGAVAGHAPASMAHCDQAWMT